MINNVDNVESVEPFSEKTIDLRLTIKDGSHTYSAKHHLALYTSEAEWEAMSKEQKMDRLSEISKDWAARTIDVSISFSADLGDSEPLKSGIYTGYQDRCVADDIPTNKVVRCMYAINSIHDSIPYKAVIKAVAALDIDAAAYMLSIMGSFPENGCSLLSLFRWSETPQGLDYWDYLNNRIEGIDYV